MGGGRQGQAVIYGEDRTQAMKGVQKVIGELGVMFKRMADIVQEQEYMATKSTTDRKISKIFSNLAGLDLPEIWQKVSEN